MSRNAFVVLIILLLCLLIGACTAKLTTIRPTLIDRIAVEDIETGAKTEVMRPEANEELDWLMDDLVFQMEQRYRSQGKCGQACGHRYHAAFYMGDRLELDVFINSDSSVCKGGRRYVQAEREQGAVDRSVDLELWAGLFQ